MGKRSKSGKRDESGKSGKGSFSGIGAGLLPDVAIAQYDEFLAGQSFQSNGAAGVDLVGRDADFRTESIFESVSESGGGVYHHRTGIHLAQETTGAAVILGNNRVGML